MFEEIEGILRKRGAIAYPKSYRRISDSASLFVVRSDQTKLVGIAQRGRAVNLPHSFGQTDAAPSGATISLHPLTWEVYQTLRELVPIAPSVCDRAASFGTGDRLGMVSAAHLDVLARYDVFPVIAQQSPRELERTNRSFRSVLLDAVMGVLESGYTDTFGADADHVKDEERFMQAIDAGYSMFTIDVSDGLQDIAGLTTSEMRQRIESLSDISRAVIRDYTGLQLVVPGGTPHTVSQDALAESAVIYEQSMNQVVRYYETARARSGAVDLEVSIDEGKRDTTPEDHLFVVEFLHRSGVDFKSLAPKFAGEFQKGVDYVGSWILMPRQFGVHAELAKRLQGYRLSLHSGSDKFSIYELFAYLTEGRYHVKTSGTSWLQAVKVICTYDAELFREMYGLCLDALAESKKAYHVRITPDVFPPSVPEDRARFYATPNVQQLFHISYGVLLAEKQRQIKDCLSRHEREHYDFVIEHIGKHMMLLAEGAIGGNA